MRASIPGRNGGICCRVFWSVGWAAEWRQGQRRTGWAGKGRGWPEERGRAIWRQHAGSDVGRAAGTGAEGSGALWRICRRGAGEAIDDRRAKIDGAALANWRPLHSTPHARAAQSLAASRRSPQDPSSPSSPASVAPRPRSRSSPSDPISYVLLTSPLSLLLHPVLSPLRLRAPCTPRLPAMDAYPRSLAPTLRPNNAPIHSRPGRLRPDSPNPSSRENLATVFSPVVRVRLHFPSSSSSPCLLTLPRRSFQLANLRNTPKDLLWNLFVHACSQV